MPAATQIPIPEHVKPILAGVEVKGTHVRIVQKVDPKTYLDCSKVLQALGGRWDRKAQATVFHTDAAPLIAEALDTGRADKRQTILQAFFTKPALARAMLDKLDLTDKDLFLEPSVGKGALVRPILDGHFTMPKIGLLIDIDDHHHESVVNLIWPSQTGEGPDYPMIAVVGNFLEMELLYRPTAIAMNPPFSRGQDIDHIKKAYQILMPGGRMVAIAGESAFLPRTRFREWLDRRGAIVERVPPDSFEGTAAAARMIYLRKSET